MSTSQTPHYGLNQWSPEDQFLREEFNADNAKTDAALAALASSNGEKAAQADLTALASAVEGKAEQAALDSLTQTVNGKAAQTALDSLTATVNKKAAQSALDSLTATVKGKANQSALDSLTATVNTKAAQTALNSLTATVNTKAAQSSLNSLTQTVNAKANQTDLNNLAAAVNVRGNCRIATGSYTGTGTYGSDSPNRLTFPFVPLLVIIVSGEGPSVILTSSSPKAMAYFGKNYARWYLTWSGTGVSWYVYTASFSNGSSYTLKGECQFNESGVVYQYIALGSAG